MSVITRETLQSDINQVRNVEDVAIQTTLDKLSPELITQKKIFIASERSKHGEGLHPDEALFQKWEEMIRNYQEALEKSRNAQAAAVPDAKKSTSPFMTGNNAVKIPDTSKEVQSEMAELKKEAGGEMSNILASNDPRKIQRALEFTEALTTMNVDKSVSWLDDHEKELLKPYIPTLKGIAGALFIEAITSQGYSLNFDQTGGLKVSSKSNDTATADTANVINTYVTNPSSNLHEIIKAGMLYTGGSLVRYTEGLKDASGTIINPVGLTPVAYAEYLKGLGANATPIEKMMRNNPKILGNIDFAAYARGTENIGPILAQAQQYASDPKNLQATQSVANAITNGTAGHNSGSDGKQQELLADWAEHPAKRALQEVALIGKKGFGEIFSSPETTLVAILGFIGVWFASDFKTALATLMGGVAVAGGYNRYTGEHVPTESEAGSTSNKKPVEGQGEKIDNSFDTQFNTALKIAFAKEDISKEKDVLNKVKDVNYETLRKTVSGEVQPTGILTQVMSDSFSKTTIETYVRYLEQKNDAIATRIKIMRESTDEDTKKAYANMSLRAMNEKIFDLNNGFKGAIAEISAAIEKATDKDEKQALQALLAHLKTAQTSGGSVTPQEGLGLWDMIWNNKGKITLGVAALYFFKKGMFRFVGTPISAAWKTFSYGFRFLRHPITTVKNMPADIKKWWENAGKNAPPPPKSTLKEKVAGSYAKATDMVRGGWRGSDFEHMDGLKSELTSKNIDTKFLDEFKGKVGEMQKLHPGSAKYLKGENELRAFLNTIPSETRVAIKVYSDAQKFMIPEQGKFVKGLITAMEDAQKTAIVGRGARFIVSLFKKF